MLSPYAGTSVWQGAALELRTVLTDGFTVDVSTNAATTYSAAGGAVAIVAPNRVSAVSPGTATVTGAFGGATSSGLAITVSATPVTASALTTTFPATFSGLPGATRALAVSAVLSDGTRLTDARAVAGFLAYGASEPAKIDVDTAGVATLHDNHHRLVTLTASAQSAVGSATTAANLEPAVGDVDLGETSGVPHPDRAPGEAFTMPVRVNTGGQTLGAIDLTVTYDTALLTATGVTAGAGWPGGQLESDIDDAAGTVHIVGAAKAGSTASGAALHVFDIAFTAAASKTSDAQIAGHLAKLVDNTLDQAPIGAPLAPGETRAIVAGAGLLDPDCGAIVPADVRGNANGDCGFDVADVSFVLQYLALLRTDAELAAWQRDAMDVDHDGQVTVADAVFLLRVLVGKFRFVSYDVSAPTDLAGPLVVAVTTYDAAGAANGDRTEVEVELGSTQAPSLVAGSDLGATTSGRAYGAAALGAGAFRLEAGGFAHAESGVGVVLVVRTRDAAGATADDRVAAFLGTPRVSALMAFAPVTTFDVGDASAPCASSPCKNGGGCAEVDGAFVCDCATTGFDGPTCEVPIDDCTPDPCNGHGTCEDGVNTYTCTCTGGYGGEDCDTPPADPCAEITCGNGGSCVPTGAETAACDCAGTGFGGALCDVEVSEEPTAPD
ncbi:MAG: hypothetical protein KC635_22145, partial [Myxococcales bacterium]|nr:hypothetical protein [Myxococcales bacterium]